MDLEHLEAQLGRRLDAAGPATRAELLRILMLPDLDRAERGVKALAERGPHLVEGHD